MIICFFINTTFKNACGEGVGGAQYFSISVQTLFVAILQLKLKVKCIKY